MAVAAVAFDFEEQTARAARLPLIGGALCLDFANTVSGLREGEHEREHLHAYAHLIAWAAHARAIQTGEARPLLKRARDDDGAAARALHRALALRDCIHDIFAAIAHRAAIPQRALDGFNAALADASRHVRLLPAEEGFAWGWDDLTARLDSPLWPILRSAADLLTTGKLDRIKQCPYPHCGWLFVDFSKNKSRRWCEMSVCGNRTKARRHYMREKQMGA